MNRRNSFALATLSVLTLALAGCPGNPFDPETWIDQLDDEDPRVVDEAVTKLQRLRDPVAIAPLGETWRRQNRPVKVLKVIIDLAECEPEESEQCAEFGTPHWDDALPVLRSALEDFDVGDVKSIENAVVASDALRLAQDKESIQTLINVVNKVMPKLSGGQRVRLAAIRALGHFGNEPRAVDTVLKVLEADPKDQPVALFAAAANALAEARSPKAIPALIETLYKVPIVGGQVRLALIASGPAVIPELIKVLEGEHKAMNDLAKRYKFNIDCQSEMGPGTNCIAPTNLEYKAAELLGDVRAKKAVGPLLDALKRPSLPAYFNEGAPGPSQHAAVLTALKQIGDPKAADKILAYATDPSTDDVNRPIAIDTYSFITTDTKALSTLAKMIKDDQADEQVRLAAGQAYGRLARTTDYGPLIYMIDRYKKKADEIEGQSKKATAAYEKAKKAHDAAQKKALAKKDNKKLADRAEKAKGRMEAKHRDSRMLESQVAGYRTYQRTFEQNLARAHIGVQCKKDPKCYLGILDKKPDELGKGLGKYIKEWKDWSDQEKGDLKIAAVERSLLELAKMGEGARPVFDQVLGKVESTERLVREGLLIVMVHTAPLPCKKCVERLDEIMESQKDQSTLDQLNAQTKAVRNYFLWAGT